MSYVQIEKCYIGGKGIKGNQGHWKAKMGTKLKKKKKNVSNAVFTSNKLIPSLSLHFQ